MGENTPTIVTDEALQYMENHTIDFISTSRGVEASILKEYYLNDIDFNTVYRNNLVPSGNRIESSSGKQLRINSQDRLIMFNASRRIYDSNEEKDQSIPVVQSLAERGKLQRRSFMAFLNGLKLPDSAVFVYASPVGTDIFIPVKYFDTINKNRLTLTVRDFSNYKYNDYMSYSQLGSTVSNVPYTNSLPVLTKNMVQAWINGKHISSSKFNIVLKGNSFDVVFNPSVAPVETYTVEIVVDKSISGRHAENYVNSQRDLFMYLPQDAANLAENAIFLHMCDIYIDGLKISNQDLTQKTYRHILYKRSDMNRTEYETEIVLTDKKVSDDAIADYLDEFMKYERWKNNAQELQGLANDNTSGQTIDPAFIDYTKLSFPPVNKYIVDSNVTRMMSNSQRAIKMIEENSYYFKSLLTYHGIEEEVYTVERNPSIPTRPNEAVTILLDPDSEDFENVNSRLLELYINNVKIPNSYLNQFEQWKTDCVKIPIKYFSKTGTDKIRLYKYPIVNFSQKWVRFNTVGQSWVGRTEYKNVDEISNLTGDLGEFDVNELRVFIVADKVKDNSEYYFLNSSRIQRYYKIVEKSDLNYTLRVVTDTSGNKDLQIQIPAGSVIGANETVLISNPNFGGCATYDLREGTDVNLKDRIILNTINSDGDLLPAIFNDYLIKVYVSGILMIPEVDYFIVTPETYPKMTNSVLIFRKKITKNDVVEIMYTGGRNGCVAGYTSIPKTNKYGFIFFENLKMPFSLNYMDLFVNDKKLCEDDIEVYSDRLIRVKNETLPFLNVSVYTRLKIGVGYFDQFVTEYMSRIDDFDSYIRNFCRDEIFDRNVPALPSEENKDINDIYETEAPSDIDDSGKTPNPVVDKVLPIRYNPLINRLAVDYNDDINKITKYFDANVRKPIFFDEYLMLVEEKHRRTHQIELDANDEATLSEDWVFDPNKYYRTSDEILKMLVEMMSTGIIDDPVDSEKTLREYRTPLLKNFMYAQDLVTLDSNKLREYDENLVLDANLVVDKAK